MKEKAAYALEGLVVGFVTHQILKDVVMPVLISCICAALTLMIHHYGKKALVWMDDKMFPKQKQETDEWKKRFHNDN